MDNQTAWQGPVVVTGTDTGVGKTVVTAAIAAAAAATGLRVAVVKPVQTGTDAGDDDIGTITWLARPTTFRTLRYYPDRLAPYTAARVSKLSPARLNEVRTEITHLATNHDLVLIEGAGGVLVELGADEQGKTWTICDLANSVGASAVLVARAGLGTLSHTELSHQALAANGIKALTVVGSWPDRPLLVHRTNLTELSAQLSGIVPQRAGKLPADQFREQAPDWLAPQLYGQLDPAVFCAKYGYQF